MKQGVGILRELFDLDTEPSRYQLKAAVEGYNKYLWNHRVIRERFPLDALVFAEHQQPWTDLDQYEKDRCKYDEETNAWLLWYVKEMAGNRDNLPPVILDLTATGVALVDGVHRASALLMCTDEIRIDAWVIR